MHKNLHQFKLPELRSFALRDLNIAVSLLRSHGDLRLLSTWINAITTALPQSATESASTEPLSGESVPAKPANEIGTALSSLHGGPEPARCLQVTWGQNVHKSRIRPATAKLQGRLASFAPLETL